MISTTTWQRWKSARYVISAVAFGTLLAACDWNKVAVGEDREEVAVDAEDNSCAAEFNRVEDGLEELESCAAECHLDD